MTIVMTVIVLVLYASVYFNYLTFVHEVDKNVKIG